MCIHIYVYVVYYLCVFLSMHVHGVCVNVYLCVQCISVLCVFAVYACSLLCVQYMRCMYMWCVCVVYEVYVCVVGVYVVFEVHVVCEVYCMLCVGVQMVCVCNI